MDDASVTSVGLESGFQQLIKQALSALIRPAPRWPSGKTSRQMIESSVTRSRQRSDIEFFRKRITHLRGDLAPDVRQSTS